MANIVAASSTASPFRGVIDFFQQIGLYDVVLPFLLVFTVVFAIFEKTKVLGTEDGHASKKNLNAIAAFVIAFLVIAAKELVAIINETVAKSVIVLFFVILFLMLVGTFHKEEKEPFYLKGSWMVVFTIIVFLAIVGIFLDAMKTSDGRTWLQRLGDFTGSGNDTIAGSVILLVIVVLFIVYAVKEPSKEHGSSGSEHH